MSGDRSIGFLVIPGEDGVQAAAEERARSLGFSTWTASHHPEVTFEERGPGTAVLVTIGGDGTFLYGARLAAPAGIPVLGVNRGRLGFLTEMDVGSLPAALEAFAAGDCRFERRSLLRASMASGGAGGSPGREALALNDVAVKSGGVKVARLHVEVDGELYGEFDCDGIVVATATGSTAYALSAGGPPVDPRVRALVVVVLAPHAVPTRPVVLPEAVTLTITLRRGTAHAAADGGAEVDLGQEEPILVEPGPELRVVRFAGSPSFFDQLRGKLRFGLPLKALER